MSKRSKEKKPARSRFADWEVILPADKHQPFTGHGYKSGYHAILDAAPSGVITLSDGKGPLIVIQPNSGAVVRRMDADDAWKVYYDGAEYRMNGGAMMPVAEDAAAEPAEVAK